MAKHKAPTEVTVAPLFEKSQLEKTIDKYKAPAAAIVLAVVAWVLINHFMAQKSRERLDQSWGTLIAQTTPDPTTGLPSAPPDTLAGLADSLKGQESGPWARLLEIQARLADRDYDGALTAIADLRRDYPDHSLVTRTYQVGDESGTIVDHLQSVAEERKAWDAEHPGLFANPPAPEGSPHVRLKTSAGTIEVALYAERAPKHVENFLKLCKEGFYDGTKFHRIVKGFMIQGGDPNSRDKGPETWGQGGMDYTLDPESSGLYHFAGVLSTAKKPGERQESGCQFFITTDPAHQLDGQHTVFGEVVSGMDIVRAISQAPVSTEGSKDRPLDPVTIESAEVVE